jgi:hypothetical protein
MDSMFNSHRENLLRMHIPVVPYSYLSVADAAGLDYKRHPELFSRPGGVDSLDNVTLTQRMAAAEAMGKFKADLFSRAYLSTLREKERSVNLSGMDGNIIVVDVEETFDPSRFSSSEIQRVSFGRFYARMLASWIKDVRAAVPNAIFVFYTFPDVYTSYLQFALPEDNAVIHGMPVWLARTRSDGSDFDLKGDKNLQRICLSTSGGNKCIMHQYSHRVVFGDAPIIVGRPPPDHVDVDRLFPVKVVPDGEAMQYVRSPS